MDIAMVKRMSAAGVDLDIQALPRQRVFEMMTLSRNGEVSKIVCKIMVFVDMELHIRHGLSLMLRSLKWLVTEKRVTDAVLGCPVFKTLRLNTHNLLAATADRFCEVADAEKLGDIVIE